MLFFIYSGERNLNHTYQAISQIVLLNGYIFKENQLKTYCELNENSGKEWSRVSFHCLPCWM
jgi:hypothetical protein